MISRENHSTGFMFALLSISACLSTLVTFYLIGNHTTYGFMGLIFWADLLCLLASYILLLPLGKSPRKTQASA